jgi:hypothetical protein
MTKKKLKLKKETIRSLTLRAVDLRVKGAAIPISSWIFTDCTGPATGGFRCRTA